MFVAFDHTVRGTGLGRLAIDNPALRQAASVVLHTIRADRLDLCVAGGWVLLPPRIAAALSPLSFDLERRVLTRDPRRELPVTLQSRAYTLVAGAQVPPAVRPHTPGAATRAA